MNWYRVADSLADAAAKEINTVDDGTCDAAKDRHLITGRILLSLATAYRIGIQDSDERRSWAGRRMRRFGDFD